MRYQTKHRILFSQFLIIIVLILWSVLLNVREQDKKQIDKFKANIRNISKRENLLTPFTQTSGIAAIVVIAKVKKKITSTKKLNNQKTCKKLFPEESYLKRNSVSKSERYNEEPDKLGRLALCEKS